MTIPAGTIRRMQASGGLAPTSLLEVQSATGNLYLWSEQQANWNSVISGAASAPYLPWIVGAPSFQLFPSTQTDTASISIQNLSGNTVMRDAASIVSKTELIGAYVYYRLWRGDGEQSIFTFTGNIVSVDIDDTQLDLGIEGLGNFSNVNGLPYAIDVACGLFYGSPQCGATALDPCQQTYGTCSSIERFMGFVVQWDNTMVTAPLVQIAQPAPVVAYNPGRAF